MSFVLVLAAAVTLVVGLLQSGLTLIYLSIACSVLAGVVLAVAVLRGRPEPRPAPAGRTFTPPERTQVPASVGAAPQSASSWTPPSYPSAQESAPPPPPPPPAEPARQAGPDLATKAAGTALLGRLRRRGQEEPSAPAAAEPAAAESSAPEPEPEVDEVAAEPTTEIPVAAAAPPRPVEGDDGFPVANYDRLRAIDLLVQLPSLDRNQLEAVRAREAGGKNRFTIMNRIDALLATKEEPAWEPEEEEWESEADTTVIAAGPADVDEELEEGFEEPEPFEEVEHDEVDELVAPADTFPIAGYDSLTVGQVLPRLSDLDADELAQVRAREQQGRNRGTILDRIDRLASRAGTGAGGIAMPPPAPPAPPAPAPRTRARKAAATASTPPPAPAPTATKAARTKKAPIPAPPPAPVKKARATKAAKASAPAPAPAVPAAAAPRKRAASRKAAAAPPPPPPTTPVKEAVKKARAASKAAVKKATKRR